MAMDFSQFDPDMQNTIKQAQQIAGLIKTQRSQQRTQPITSALSGLGEQYKSAQTDEQRQQANSLANMTRANYLQGGGSPSELPSQYWGSDPGQGFQTSEGFQAPITGYEGLKRADAISNRRQSLSDLFEKQKWQATPESQDWYLPAAKQQAEATLANTRRSANAPYGGGGGGASKPSQTVTDRGNYGSALQGVGDALAALSGAMGGQPYADKYSTEYGVLAPVQVIEKQINTQRPQLISQGIDPDKLINEAYQMAYGKNKKDYWDSANGGD